MFLVQLLCGTLSPRDACWVDLLPDQASIEASRDKAWIIGCCIFPLSLTNIVVFHNIVSTGIASLDIVWIPLICNSIFFSSLLVYVHNTDLVRGRRLVYFMHLQFLIRSSLHAFVDPVDMAWFAFVIGRRLLFVFLMSVWQAVMFQQVVYRLFLVWALPGLVLYVIRFCVHMSVEIDAESIDFPIVGPFGWHFPLFPGISSVIPYLAFVALIGFTKDLRGSLIRRTRRSINQVQSIAFTPTSVPNMTIGIPIPVVPDASSDHPVGVLAPVGFAHVEPPQADVACRGRGPDRQTENAANSGIERAPVLPQYREADEQMTHDDALTAALAEYREADDPDDYGLTPTLAFGIDTSEPCPECSLDRPSSGDVGPVALFGTRQVARQISKHNSAGEPVLVHSFGEHPSLASASAQEETETVASEISSTVPRLAKDFVESVTEIHRLPLTTVTSSACEERMECILDLTPYLVDLDLDPAWSSSSTSKAPN